MGAPIVIGAVKNKLDVRKWLPTILLVRRTNTVPLRAQRQEWIEGMPDPLCLDDIYLPEHIGDTRVGPRKMEAFQGKPHGLAVI